MLEKKRSKVGLIASIVLVALFLSAGAGLLLNRQYVIDQINVWNYQPTVAIEEIVDDIDLTDSGIFYLYVTHPEVESAAEFNVSCPQREVNNPILGCYTGERIFIYDVTDESLAGIKQVTAAHELLHAAWDRLGESDRESIIDLLKKEYESIKDPEFHERMGYYERTEPGEYYNELHSIIGTEQKTISPELEEYYQRYFDDRQLIVGYHGMYSSVFESLESRSESLYEQLVALDKQIDSKRAAYTQNLAALSADIIDFNERADAGDFSSTTQFFNERNQLNARKNQLEADRIELNSLVDVYNVKYNEYKEVASQIQQLNSSIDSMSSAPAVPTFEN